MFHWGRRRSALHSSQTNFKKYSNDLSEMEIAIPTHFRCPISLELMKDPVTLSTGITYDRDSIEKWIESGNRTCPVTNQVLLSLDQIPNHSIRKMIQDWCVENRSHGFERIPTPRVPVTPYEVSETCRKVLVASQRGDHKKCQELVKKVKNWGKESDRNKRCIVENGCSGVVLAACFEAFSSVDVEKYEELLVEILSVLVWMFPFSEEIQMKLGMASSLSSMVWLLENGDLCARQNSVLVMKQLLSLDQSHVNALAEIEGVVETLVRLIKEPICPRATKASISAIFYMISPSNISNKVISAFVKMGLVDLVLEILVDGDKAMREKALGVLDHISDSEEGRKEVYDNVLIVPVLLEKISRVSNLASELSVSILWKLCENTDRSEGVIIEALQQGAFQKLLVLLQVGCGRRTKERVYEMLKLLKRFGDKLDCVDYFMDFKYLKKP